MISFFGFFEKKPKNVNFLRNGQETAMNIKTFWMVFRRIMAAVLCFTVIAAGAGLAYVYIAPAERITPNSMDVVVGGRINVMILATDKGGLLTDTMMLASCDSDRKLINVMSFPRDTRVKIGKSYQKLNAVYALGEAGKRHEHTMKYIRELTGMPIHYYVVVNPSGFRKIIDALGGVYIDVPIRMKYSDPDQGLYIDLQPGYQLLDGNKAEQFTRFRSGYANADLGRIEAQQNFVKALIAQKLRPEYFMKAGEIFEHVEENVDTNFKVSDVPVFLKIFQSLTGDGVHTFEMPLTTQMIDGISYVICDVPKTRQLIDREFLGITEENSIKK